MCLQLVSLGASLTSSHTQGITTRGSCITYVNSAEGGKSPSFFKSIIMTSKDYVFKVKMTYKSLDVTVWQLLSVVASTREEAVEKAHKRWSDWQQDIKQYQVLYKWDYESAKTIAILAGTADVYAMTYQ